MKDVLGGKGAGLAEMTNLGIPVPPGFTIATTLCLQLPRDEAVRPRLRAQVEPGPAAPREGHRQGSSATGPIRCSSRCAPAPPVSMPGMMETILNLGLNDETVEGLAQQSGNPAFAWDSYRRFVQMYANVVFDLPKTTFEQRARRTPQARGGRRARHRPAARRC